MAGYDVPNCTHLSMQHLGSVLRTSMIAPALYAESARDW
jgi:hypothetical protein